MKRLKFNDSLPVHHEEVQAQQREQKEKKANRKSTEETQKKRQVHLLYKEQVMQKLEGEQNDRLTRCSQRIKASEKKGKDALRGKIKVLEHTLAGDPTQKEVQKLDATLAKVTKEKSILEERTLSSNPFSSLSLWEPSQSDNVEDLLENIELVAQFLPILLDKQERAKTIYHQKVEALHSRDLEYLRQTSRSALIKEEKPPTPSFIELDSEEDE